MVFATAYDSCNTLIGLEENSKNINALDCVSSGQNEVSSSDFVSTKIMLPADDYLDYWCENVITQPIYLPVNEEVDGWLKNVPQILQNCDDLLANSPRYFAKHSKESFLYVSQGEVAHALPEQCDILVSDKATTCHIMAWQSKFGKNTPLTSLTHIDGTSYEACIDKMMREHLEHHQRWAEGVQTKKDAFDLISEEKIELQVHIMGGFNDSNSTSSKTSTWLIRLLADLALEYEDVVKITLQTCAITSMNDDGHACPIGRGLGINLHSGEVFLAKVDGNSTGPAMDVRSVRLWSVQEAKHLSVIHTSQSDGIRVDAFQYEATPESSALLTFPDQIILQLTSTSPEVEEDDFCSSIRRDIKFMHDVKCHSIFGCDLNQSIVFQRISTSNTWVRAV